MPSSRNHHSKLEISTWALYILPTHTVDRAETFWISFFNIFKCFSIQIASAVKQILVYANYTLQERFRSGVLKLLYLKGESLFHVLKCQPI